MLFSNITINDYMIGISWNPDWFFWGDGSQFIDLFRNGGTEKNRLNFLMNVAHDLLDLSLKTQF